MYSQEQIQAAFKLWNQANNGADPTDPIDKARREATWENYCDYRDGLPHGTTSRRASESEIGRAREVA